jgi:hypothetical protein
MPVLLISRVRVFSNKRLRLSVVCIIIVVVIATGYGLDGQGSIPGNGIRLFSTLQRPDWLWVPPSLLHV